MNIRELFSSFPVINQEVDIVAIDVIMFDDEGKYYYTPLIGLLMNDNEKQIVEASLTLITGHIASSLEEVTNFIESIVTLSIFPWPLSAIGTVYNKNMEEIDEVNWNDIYLFRNKEKDVTTENQDILRVLH